MPRQYTAPINIGATTTAIDLFEIAAVTWSYRLCGFEIGQLSEVGDAQEEQLHLLLKRVTGSPTSGSGGGTSTFQRIDGGDNTASATIETGNTTKMTGGTSLEMRRFAWNVRQPLQIFFNPDFCHFVIPGQWMVLELVGAPADSISGIVGWVELEELP